MGNEYLSLSQAARAVPTVDGRQPSPSTVWRWMSSGLRGGVKLRHVRIGHRTVTTRPWLDEFFQALAWAEPPARTPEPCTAAPRPRTAKQRERAIERAEKHFAQVR